MAAARTLARASVSLYEDSHIHNIGGNNGLIDDLLRCAKGESRLAKPQEELPEICKKLQQATSLPPALMFAVQNEQDMLCQIFGKCLVGD